MSFEHPQITRTNRTGYPFTPRNPRPAVSDACDVCNRWAAVVRFNQTKLCADCGAEEGITVL